MIRSYQRGLMKCIRPAKTKKGPKRRRMQGNLSAERRLRLGDRETPLVERLADDHAFQVLQPQLGKNSQVVDRSDAARVDHLRLSRRGDLAERVEVGPLHQTVHVDRRVDEAPNASFAEPRDD